jgi:hypothetical protein
MQLTAIKVSATEEQPYTDGPLKSSSHLKFNHSRPFFNVKFYWFFILAKTSNKVGILEIRVPLSAAPSCGSSFPECPTPLPRALPYTIKPILNLCCPSLNNISSSNFKLSNFTCEWSDIHLNHRDVLGSWHWQS